MSVEDYNVVEDYNLLPDSRLHGKRVVGTILIAVGVGMNVVAATAAYAEDQGKLKNMPAIAVQIVSGMRR